jgi:hypothetical protein
LTPGGDRQYIVDTMNFYVVNGISSKALAVLNCKDYEEACLQAAKKFRKKEVIVLDKELYYLEQRVGYRAAKRLARRLIRAVRPKKHG